MQRLPIVIIVAVIVVIFSYYPPLRNLVFPEKKEAAEIADSQRSKEKDDKFEKLGIELYTANMRRQNFEGKVALFKMAQKNQDWFKPEEYAQLPGLLAKAEEDLKEAEAEYEKTKIKYAQENVRLLIKEAMGKKESGESKK